MEVRRFPLGPRGLKDVGGCGRQVHLHQVLGPPEDAKTKIPCGGPASVRCSGLASPSHIKRAIAPKGVDKKLGEADCDRLVSDSAESP